MIKAVNFLKQMAWKRPQWAPCITMVQSIETILTKYCFATRDYITDFQKKAREGNLKSFKIFENATFVYGNDEEEKAG